LPIVEFDIGCACAHDGGDADAGLHQVVQGKPSARLVDEDGEQIIDCLKHIKRRNLPPPPTSYFLCTLSRFLTLSRVVQALTLMKARTNKRVVVPQGAHVAELEENNTKLLVELEQTHLVLAEAEAAHNSLSANPGKFQEECASLCTAINTLGREKVEVVAAREAEITTVCKKIKTIMLVTARSFTSVGST
jgi:hypothetical protein